MEVDEDDMDILINRFRENKLEQSSDSEGSINDYGYGYGGIKEYYFQFYSEYGEKCLYNLSYGELDEIYVDIYGEDPDFSMNKMDVIKCLVEYYNNK